MARISIYVSDQLKKRMEPAGDAINWSEVARPSFEAAVATYQHEKDQTMSTAIERLRTSKQKTDQDNYFSGQQDGRTWARDTAEHADLLRLSRVHFPNEDYRGAIRALKAAIDPKDELGISEVCEYCFGDDNDRVSDDYVAGFIEGANEFFEGVKDQL